MATDHANHVVSEEVMWEGVRGGGGEEGRLVHLNKLLTECSCRRPGEGGGWSQWTRGGGANIT